MRCAHTRCSPGSSCGICRTILVRWWRLVIGTPTPYTLPGRTLAEEQAQLPPALEHSERQPSDLPEVAEVWIGLKLTLHLWAVVAGRGSLRPVNPPLKSSLVSLTGRHRPQLPTAEKFKFYWSQGWKSPGESSG
jgi:hypothetical protein